VVVVLVVVVVGGLVGACGSGSGCEVRKSIFVDANGVRVRSVYALSCEATEVVDEQDSVRGVKP
jgi:hypothetical protein